MLTKGIILKLQLFPGKNDVRGSDAQGKMRRDGLHECTPNMEPPCAGGRLAISRPPEEREIIPLANILVNMEKGVEISARDALKWLTGAGKIVSAAPAAIAALAVLVETYEKPIMDIAGAAANPLNIPLDIETAKELVAAWPEVKAFLTTLGIKF
jgi:hypothetical protein